uniref:C-type lectin domain-containing protein n=1 Tax=Ursus americanus TaxID=9643 RepID=A0A452RNQ8_URSAM
MSNEQVIYSTLRFLRSPSESPNRLRPGGTQRPGKTDDTGNIHLSYRGIKYYYFIPESQNWKGCKQTCQSYNSSLLKINDEDELAFIQSRTYSNNYWIGLSYDDREQKWKWIDTGPPFGINYTFMSSSGRGQCAFLTSTRTTPIECSKTYGCICEGRIDDLFSAHFDRYKKKR